MPLKWGSLEKPCPPPRSVLNRAQPRHKQLSVSRYLCCLSDVGWTISPVLQNIFLGGGRKQKNGLIFSRQNNSSNFNNFLLLYWNSFAPKPAPPMTPIIPAGFSGGENIPFPFCFLFSQMLAIFLCFLQTPAHLCVIGKLGWTQQLPNFSIKLSRSPPKTGCASLQHLFCYPLTFCLHITSPETLSSHFLPPSFPTTHCISCYWLWNHPFSLTK